MSNSASFSWTRILREATNSTGGSERTTVGATAHTGKRERSDDDDDCTIPHNVVSADVEDHGDYSSAAACRPTKRLRTDGPELVSFYKPYPCAYYNACRFRASCSYHHGVAQACDCHDVQCPRGHAHRRAPRACQHGASACRWKLLGECSFHHGVAFSCSCNDLACPCAHLERTRKQTAIRKEVHGDEKDKKKREENARKLFFIFKKAKNCTIQKDELHKTISQAIQVATTGSTTTTTTTEAPPPPPLEQVKHNSGERHGFLCFHSPIMATTCLINLNGLHFPGTGRITLKRPEYYSESTSKRYIPVMFDTTALDIPKKQAAKRKKNKKKKKAKKAPAENRTEVMDDASLESLLDDVNKYY